MTPQLAGMQKQQMCNELTTDTSATVDVYSTSTHCAS
jgi:hypothetical protein